MVGNPGTAENCAKIFLVPDIATVRSTKPFYEIIRAPPPDNYQTHRNLPIMFGGHFLACQGLRMLVWCLRPGINGVVFFFLKTRFVQFIKKRLNKSPTRYRGRNYAYNFEQKLRSNSTHTQHTPIHKTPHTTRHPHSLQTY